MDLPALQTYLAGLPRPLVLRADDANLPQELRDFLTTTPNASLSVAATGGGTLAGSTLTLDGASSDTWPVAGLDGVTVALAHATVVLTDGASVPVTGTATGVATLLPSLTSAVTLTSANGTPDVPAGAWHMATTAELSGAAPFDLLMLGRPGQQAPFPVPPDLGALTQAVVVPAGGLAVTFMPAESAQPVVFTVDVSLAGVSWTLVPSMLELDGVDVLITASATTLSVRLVGHVTVADVAMDVTLGMSPSSIWTVGIAPTGGGAFPGVAALAAWAGGSALSTATTNGFGAVKFDTGGFDAQISQVLVAFDWKARALQYVDVGSLLTLGALALDVGLRLPDVAVTGSLHGGPVLVADVLTSFGLPSGGVPAGMAIETVTFDAEPANGTYLATLEVADVWSAGPLDIENVTVEAEYAGGVFSGFVHGTVAVGTLVLMLDAEYDGTAGGWTFGGSTAPGSTLEIGDLLTELGSSFGIGTVPAPIASLDLTALAVTYATATGAFTFTCTGGLTIVDTPVTVSVAIAVTKSQPGDANDPQAVVGTSGYAARFGGTVTLAGLELDLVFDVASSGTEVLVASFSPTGGATTLSLHSLVASVSESVAEAVPTDLEIGLADVKFAWVKQTASVFVIGIDLSASVSLSELPLVGDRLPAGETLAVQQLQLLYASQPLDATTVKTLVNPLLPKSVVPLPEAGLAGGVAVTATVRLGDTTQALSLGVPATPAPAAPPKTSPTAPAAPPATTSRSAGYWVDVQKKVGAVQFKRVGVLYQSNALLFGIDAALTVGPVTLSVDGLAFGSPLTKFEPTFSVTGLGIAYASPPVTIDGALLNVPASSLAPGVSFQFDGTAVVDVEDLSLAAIGSYAQTTAGPSLFVFVQVEAPLGGPPAFFVTGLMGGFGVNRSLTLPAQNEVESFPLLVLNQPPTPGTTPVTQDPMHVLDVLEGRAPAVPNGTAKAWIAPAPGEYWLALGVEFTSFELVRSRALLVAELGDEFELALLGLSTLQLPQPGESPETYAYAELELEAVLKPSEGFFGLTAVLSPASYVITPACHLTGGFAFYVWFGDNDNAGQFVVTLGGYHPAFAPPPYFPTVPRLGFAWAVSDAVSISGNAYFALTTTCAMAGGSLQVLFHDGGLQAWFTAQLDVLIAWRPFSFDADASVSIGVSYRLNLLFCHKTISLSLGASVNMWGPPTGGIVHVHLWCVSFTVAFGSGQGGGARTALGWPAFSSLLPPAASAVTVLPVAGMYKTGTSAVSTDGKLWVVRARDLRFATQSSVPASHLRYGDTPATTPGTTGADYTAGLVDVRPMNLAGVTSVHRLVVRQGSRTADPADVSEWVLTPRTQNVPVSLWGAPPSPFTQVPAAPGNDVLRDQQVGYDVQAAPPAVGASPGLVALTELMEEYLPPGRLPIGPGTATSTAYVPVADPQSVGLVAGVAAAEPARAALLAALGNAGVYTGTAGALTAFAAAATHLFADPPMRQT